MPSGFFNGNRYTNPTKCVRKPVPTGSPIGHMLLGVVRWRQVDEEPCSDSISMMLLTAPVCPEAHECCYLSSVHGHLHQLLSVLLVQPADSFFVPYPLPLGVGMCSAFNLFTITPYESPASRSTAIHSEWPRADDPATGLRWRTSPHLVILFISDCRICIGGIAAH